MEFLSCDVFINFLLDEQAGRLQLNAYAGIPEEEAGRIEWLDFGVAVCGCVARDRERIIAEDVQNSTDPQTSLVKSFGIQAYCCHPLLIRDRLIGTLSFGTRARTRFSEDDVALMNEVANLTSVAMDRVRTEQALREMGQDLNRAQAVGLIGSWRLDVRRNVLEWSEQNWRIFGVARGTPLSYETFLSTVHPEDRAAVDKAWKSALGGNPYDTEHRIVRGDEIRWVRERAELEFDENGILLGGFGTTQDITERKAAEAKLEWLASFPELSPIPVAEIDLATNMIGYLNPSTRRLFPDLEALGTAHPFLAGLPEMAGALDDAARTRLNRELTVGEAVYAQVIAPISGLSRVRVYSMDITERRRMERVMLEMERLKILERSQKVWQNTFDGITDLISVHDQDGTILMANRAFLDAFGLTLETMHEKRCYQLFHGDEATHAHCPMPKTWDTGLSQSSEFSETQLGRTYDISTFPFLSAEGTTEGIIHIAKDVTERKQTEMGLILSDRLAALGQMASGIAHELNNPLATISGCAEGLQSRAVEGSLETWLLRDYLEIIREEITRCKAITANMLSFVRKGSSQKRALNVAETLDRTLELIGFQGRLLNVEIGKHYPATPLVVMAAEGELKQVYIILLSNALDAQEDRDRLEVAAGADDSHVWVSIRDAGPGIPADIADRIFDPFFTTKPKGTGLGLAIARKIVESLDGTITLEETSEKGSTFLLRLPRAEETEVVVS
jgi:PAS domain S-box-containing protein